MAEFDYFRDLGYPEREIAGMAQRAAQPERLATAEAAVAAQAGETPAKSVALPPTTVPDTGIPSWVKPVGHRLLVGDSDQREALRECCHMGLVCFPSENLVFSDSERVTWELLFQGLRANVGFDPYYQGGVELGKSRTVVTTAVSVFRQPATPIVSEAMEPGPSGTSNVSQLDAANVVGGDTTRQSSGMQLSSSDEVSRLGE